MHGILDQQKITIDVTPCISWILRSIKSVKLSPFFQSSAPIMGMYNKLDEELLIEIINLNKGKSREPSKHLLELEQMSEIFKDTTKVVIIRVYTLTAPTTPTA